MNKLWRSLAVLVLGLAVLSAAGALAAPGPRLVSTLWLAKHLGQADLLLLDASPSQLYAVKHIAGAVSVDVFSYGGRERSLADMEKLMRSWGLARDRQVVIYDQGASYLATSLFFDLVYHGFPEERLFILDGGLAKWQAENGAVSKEATAIKPGDYSIAGTREEVRVRLPEFLVATGDRHHNALVDALDAAYYYGGKKFFERGGHVPQAINLPAAELFNADKTFKSPEELRAMFQFLQIQPEQTILTHCGGGVAASGPFFALKYLAGYPKVKLYKESQLEWQRDERQLPFWTYAAPYLLRDRAWLEGWNAPMLRAFGAARMSIVDVRPSEQYLAGHVAFALNLPAATLRKHLHDPKSLAQHLGSAGVHFEDEAVVISAGGLTPDGALAYLALELAGQKRVSLLMESMDDWGLSGQAPTREPTTLGPPKSLKEFAVMPAVYAAQAREGVLAQADAPRPAGFPRVYIAAEKNAAVAPAGEKVVVLHYRELLTPEGRPKPAKDLLALFEKAGLPRYAELVAVGDDPGEAAVVYVVLKLMGYPRVRVMAG